MWEGLWGGGWVEGVLGLGKGRGPFRSRRAAQGLPPPPRHLPMAAKTEEVGLVGSEGSNEGSWVPEKAEKG